MSAYTNSSRIWRVLWSLVVLATCLRVWLGPIELAPRAAAQIPDSGLQRQQMLAEAKRTNTLLSELIRTLKTQTIKVRVEGSDEKGKGLSVLPATRK